MNGKITTLYMTVDDGEASFDVPTDWLETFVGENYDTTLDDFMGEYTTEESEDIYGAAILDSVIEYKNEFEKKYIQLKSDICDAMEEVCSNCNRYNKCSGGFYTGCALLEFQARLKEFQS